MYHAYICMNQEVCITMVCVTPNTQLFLLNHAAIGWHGIQPYILWLCTYYACSGHACAGTQTGVIASFLIHTHTYLTLLSHLLLSRLKEELIRELVKNSRTMKGLNESYLSKIQKLERVRSMHARNVAHMFPVWVSEGLSNCIGSFWTTKGAARSPYNSSEAKRKSSGEWGNAEASRVCDHSMHARLFLTHYTLNNTRNHLPPITMIRTVWGYIKCM